jgi:hypothetical protein
MAKKKRVSRKKKPAGKKSKNKKSKKSKKKAATRKRAATKRRRSARKKPSRASRRSRPKNPLRAARRNSVDVPLDVPVTGRRHGLGAGSAGQSGDTQGLSDAEEADSESVEELVEEGQNFEAGVVSGVEGADADQREVRTRQVREDDVPLEYLEKD